MKTTKEIRAKKKLFSFCIVAYNNYEYITEAVDSVLEQDYERIELIVSNDGSKDFDEEELAKYIELKKRDNIENVVINNNEKNVGTVKNVNIACEAANGDYIMIMAADDALYNAKVLSRFAKSFENENKNAYCISAKIAMCKHSLDEIAYMEPSEDGISVIKSKDSKKIFSTLSHTAIIPTTSTCYRRELFEELGKHDEDYFIIEDVSLYLKMARLNYEFGWIDDFVATRHRDGGISHGNARNKSETYRRYRFDEILLFVKEILPNKNLINNKDLILMERKWAWLEGAYYKEFLLLEDGSIDYREYDQEICESLLDEMKKECAKNSLKGNVKSSVEEISVGLHLKKIIGILFVTLVFSIMEKVIYVCDIKILGSTFCIYIVLIGVYISLLGLLIRNLWAVAMRLLWKGYKVMKRILKGK